MPVARLLSAQSVPYSDRIIASGATKDVYLTADGQQVVAFYRDPKIQVAPAYRERLKQIVSTYNLTLPVSDGGAAGSDAQAAHMRKLFCWPTGVAVAPRLGFVAPVFPERYWFRLDPRNLPVKDTEWQGVEKKVAWLTESRARRTLARRERGDFKSLLRACIQLSHAVARLHGIGLVHSDLSSNNVLVDPIGQNDSSGWPGCLVIDLDTLVVPGFFPPAVSGTRGYFAPEVLATSRLSSDKQLMPNKTTDRHALSVLIYQLLFARHPLDGPKMRSAESEDEDEFLAFGSEALFVEHPSDASNHLKRIAIPYRQLGAELASLIEMSFVTGLTDPSARPLAVEWEAALWRAHDLLHPCSNSTCSWRWFIFHETTANRCPNCGTSVPSAVARFDFQNDDGARARRGDRLVCWSGQKLYRWHTQDGVSRVPAHDDAVAEVVHNAADNGLRLRNTQTRSIRQVHPREVDLPPGSQHPLESGAVFRFCDEPGARFGRFLVHGGPA